MKASLASWAAALLLTLNAFGADDTTASPQSPPTPDLKLPELILGTVTYSNVTIIDRTPTDVFFTHSEGMGNVKPSDLDADTLELLGYALTKDQRKARAKKLAGETDDGPGTLTTTNTLAAISGALADLPPEFDPAKKQVEALALRAFGPDGSSAEALMKIQQVLDQHGKTILIALLLTLPILYLFYCYTAALVCRKAGTAPGALIWVPILQMIPLLKAAGMPAWTIILMFVPVANIILSIVWCVKICRALQKGPLTILLILLPVTSAFAWLYLAFSEAAPGPFSRGRNTRSAPPRPVEVSGTFFHHAATCSLMAPVIAILARFAFKGALGLVTAEFIVAGILAAGGLLGLLSLVGIRHYGASGILAKSATGLVAMSILFAIAIPNFLNARERARAQQEVEPTTELQLEQAPSEQAHEPLETKLDQPSPQLSEPAEKKSEPLPETACP